MTFPAQPGSSGCVEAAIKASRSPAFCAPSSSPAPCTARDELHGANVTPQAPFPSRRPAVGSAAHGSALIPGERESLAQPLRCVFSPASSSSRAGCHRVFHSLLSCQPLGLAALCPSWCCLLGSPAAELRAEPFRARNKNVPNISSPHSFG